MRERKKIIWVCSKLFTVKNLRTQNLKNSYIFTKHIFQLYTHSWIHGGIQSRATENLHTNCPNIIVHTSGKFEVECLTGRKNGFAQIFSWPRYLNPLFFNMRSDIYHHCSIFILQFSNICDIFARSKFVSIHFFVEWVMEIMERLTGMNDSYLKNNN